MSKRIMIPVAVVLTAGTLVGAFFGVQTVYQSGIKKGKEEAFNETKTNVENLGLAMNEKNDFQKRINEVLGNTPAEVNTESIAAYIDGLESVVNETKNESVKETLANYLNKWREFQKTYESKDNNAITAAFNDLKTTAIDTATSIKTLYDQAIVDAIDNL